MEIMDSSREVGRSTVSGSGKGCLEASASKGSAWS